MEQYEGREVFGGIMNRLDRVEEGNFGDCKAVGKGVLELRIDFGPGYRVYFGRLGNVMVILLGGGTKSSQSADIKQAQKYWREFCAEENA